MSQNNVDYSLNPTGPQLMDDFLAKEQENVLTSNSGVTRPTYAKEGMKWLDKSVTPWVYKMFDGADDIIIGYVDPTNDKFISSNNPMTTTGDLIVQGTDGNPRRLAAAPAGAVLTSNGVGQIPGYKVSDTGVKKYFSSQTYKLNDFVIVYSSTDDKTVFYRSKVTNNTAPLTDTNSWEKLSLGTEVIFRDWSV